MIPDEIMASCRQNIIPSFFMRTSNPILTFHFPECQNAQLKLKWSILCNCNRNGIIQSQTQTSLMPFLIVLCHSMFNSNVGHHSYFATALTRRNTNPNINTYHPRVGSGRSELPTGMKQKTLTLRSSQFYCQKDSIDIFSSAKAKIGQPSPTGLPE